MRLGTRALLLASARSTRGCACARVRTCAHAGVHVCTCTCVCSCVYVRAYARSCVSAVDLYMRSSFTSSRLAPLIHTLVGRPSFTPPLIRRIAAFLRSLAFSRIRGEECLGSPAPIHILEAFTLIALSHVRGEGLVLQLPRIHIIEGEDSACASLALSHHAREGFVWSLPRIFTSSRPSLVTCAFPCVLT